MPSILHALQNREMRRFAAGEIVIEQSTQTGHLFFLVEGSVEILKDGMVVAKSSEPGAIFGDLAALLGGNHTATVRTLTSSSFRIVENPREFLHSSPEVCLHLCELLARRLEAVTQYLVDVKQQFVGHDHIGMVESCVNALLLRPPRTRVRPPDSIIHQGESAC